MVDKLKTRDRNYKFELPNYKIYRFNTTTFIVSKVTNIYYLTDDFCKEFALQQEKYMIEDKKRKHCNKPSRMSDAEIMVVLILFHSGGFRCFKHHYKEYVCKHLKHLFPRRVSYNRFVELEKEVLFPLVIFIRKVYKMTKVTYLTLQLTHGMNNFLFAPFYFFVSRFYKIAADSSYFRKNTRKH